MTSLQHHIMCFFCPKTEAHSPKYGCGLARVKRGTAVFGWCRCRCWKSINWHIYILYIYSICFYFFSYASLPIRCEPDEFGSWFARCVTPCVVSFVRVKQSENPAHYCTRTRMASCGQNHEGTGVPASLWEHQTHHFRQHPEITHSSHFGRSLWATRKTSLWATRKPSFFLSNYLI